MRAGDWLIVAILLGLCTLVVIRHLEHPTEERIVPPPIHVGESLDASVVLRDVGGVDRALADWLGPKATVLYSWKVSCPCIDVCEPRLRQLFQGYGKDRGVSWIGIDGEPEDTAAEVIDRMGHVQAFYKMLLDPEHELLSRLGFDRATLVAVLDGSGRLRYRGSLDDDYVKPTRSYLGEALAAVVDGAPLAVPETAPVYGCSFSQPPSCYEPTATASSAAPVDPGSPTGAGAGR